MSLRVAALSVGRSDYGIFVPVLRLLQQDEKLDLRLIVAAAHLDPKYGNTVQEIERDGFPIEARLPITMHGDSRQDVAAAIGLCVQEFASAYQRIQPDLLLLLGDRYEMFAAAIAALPLRIPIAHIAGGELTFGAIDDAIRHATTKLSHIHFATTSVYAQRIRQMGEEPWRVHVTGSPSIDAILALEPISQAELEAEIGLDLHRTLLITYHPVTLEDNQTEHISNLLSALSASGQCLLFTYPNADAQNSEIICRVKEFVEHTSRARLISNLGHRKYHSLQRYVAAMVGNSSSGIVEAASYHLPVINIGNRQAGRVRTTNVIDVGNSKEEISKAIELAVSSAFRNSIANIENPYGDGRAAERILRVLRSLEIGPSLLVKKFIDQHFN